MNIQMYEAENGVLLPGLFCGKCEDRIDEGTALVAWKSNAADPSVEDACEVFCRRCYPKHDSEYMFAVDVKHFFVWLLIGCNIASAKDFEKTLREIDYYMAINRSILDD